MEFDYNISNLFPDEITLIDGESLSHLQRNRAHITKNLKDVIDELGKRSAKAQNLTGSITSLFKTQLNGQRIYVLKTENNNNSGRGGVIGFIKVGKKRLFLLNHDGKHNELNPLCVLDFYIHESYQRRGHGLKLFNHMLKEENVQVQHLAVDRPSQKFICFLKKHFKLWATIPQVNNFVIFDGFFTNRHQHSNGCKSASHPKSAAIDGRDAVRPLSRAVSENVLQRKKWKDTLGMNGTVNSIRPPSGNESSTNGYHHPVYRHQNNRRKRWSDDVFGNKSNLYPFNESQVKDVQNSFSRYNKRVLPPISGVTNQRSDSPSYDDGRAIVPPSADDQQPSLPLNSDTEINQHDSQRVDAHKPTSPPAPSDTRETVSGSPQRPPQYNRNRANTTTNGRMYRDPSDMLAELRRKDQQQHWQLGDPTRNHRRRRTWHQRGTADQGWNVLGVPVNPPSWAK